MSETNAVRVKTYEVIITSKLVVFFEAVSRDEAVTLASEWVADEYGDLVHLASFEVQEVVFSC